MNSLSSILQETKEEINIKINEIINEKNIPACLIEGILMGIVSDVREQKNAELFEDIKKMREELKEAKAAVKKTTRTESEEIQEQDAPENPEE